MNEKILIRSKHYHTQTVLAWTCLPMAIILLFLLILLRSTNSLKIRSIFVLILPLSLYFNTFFIYRQFSSYSIIVTDTCIYGEAGFGNYLSIPLDAVSYIKISWWLKKIYIGTAAGKITFTLIKNQSDIYSVINGLQIERQERKNYIWLDTT